MARTLGLDLLLTGLVLLVGAGLSAQQPASKPAANKHVLRIIKRLESPDLVEVARGAHEADVHGLTALVPELRKSLHRLARQKTIKVAPYDTSMPLLDALIRLEATLPPNEIERWLTGSTLPAAMVLVARQPKKCERLLLDVFESSGKGPWDSEAWEVAGNLLVSIKSGKLAPRIVSGLHASLSVNLHDAGSTIGLGTGADTSSSQRPRITANDLYHMEKWCASPPLAIYFPEDISRCKLEWICGLLDIKIETQPFQLWDRATIAWKDSDTYVRKIKVEKEKVEGSFRSLINRMQLKGLVTKEEASGIKPEVSIHVFDHRQNDTMPLPEIEGVTVEKAKK